MLVAASPQVLVIGPFAKQPDGPAAQLLSEDQARRRGGAEARRRGGAVRWTTSPRRSQVVKRVGSRPRL